MTREACVKKLLDMMDEAYALLKQIHPEATQLSMCATEYGACVQGYRVAPSWEESKILDGYKSPKGDYQINL